MRQPHDIANDLWEDFLSLGSKYQNEFSVPDLGSHLLVFVYKMLLDCAPNREVCVALIQDSYELAVNWHKGES